MFVVVCASLSLSPAWAVARVVEWRHSVIPGQGPKGGKSGAVREESWELLRPRDLTADGTEPSGKWLWAHLDCAERQTHWYLGEDQTF